LPQRGHWSCHHTPEAADLPADGARLVELLHDGQPDAARLWDELVEVLSIGITNLAFLFTPAAIILGGGLRRVDLGEASAPTSRTSARRRGTALACAAGSWHWSSFTKADTLPLWFERCSILSLEVSGNTSRHETMDACHRSSQPLTSPND
jgi:predicted NBD/HSP70 family sugar kinase